MKRILALPILVLLCNLASAQYASLGEFRGREAHNLWPGAEVVWLKHYNILPAFIQFRNGAEPDEATFFQFFPKKFNLPSAYSFQPLKTESDNLGWRHAKYQVLVNGVPVLNGIFVLHIYNGKVKKYNGYVFTNIYIPTVPSLTEQDAFLNAVNEIGASSYKWEIPAEELFIKRETGNDKATFKPKGELIIVQLGDNSSNNFKLCWRFDIYAHQPMGRYYVYIDAERGGTVAVHSRICTANTPGTAETAYRGTQNITTDSYNGAYRLRETTRGLGVRTFNMQKGTSYGNAVDFTDADNHWNNVNANKDQYATDAHWGAEMTYDFYQQMGRNSIDGNGHQLNLYVHYSSNYANAFWDGSRMTFGDGNSTTSPLTSLDITGHEVTHGLDEHTADLIYQNESGALDESFSDIFGTCVEYFAAPAQFNWLVGEDIGYALRSMSNPNAYGDPDTYMGNNWYSGTADNGGVHTNSGVQNHWFYRLTTGGTGTNDNGDAFNVSGIGLAKAQQIAWRNQVNYLTSSADYADARFYAIQAAIDLFGPCSPEVISTTKAWYAVGVGPDFTYGTDAQFTFSPTGGCTIPTTINFTNQTVNGGSYVWHFGDGTTSTQANPTHTYTAFGNYTIKLVADGGVCGTDSLVMANAISLQANNPCVVIMPATGTYQTQTGCTGTIYDNGGPNDNYADNTNSIVTIAPAGAASVTLQFTQFALESGYDYLYVYDGPSTASPLIGAYTGTNLPTTIISTAPAVTLRHYSDVYVVDAGFTINWQCNQPTGTPTANFKANVTESCRGDIQFTDLSTGGASQWLWNFGDGATSTQQHPTHTYTAAGVYNVSLRAGNNYGNNTLVKSAYINITKPAGPVVVADSSCGPASFTALAQGGDSVTWYNAAGVRVFTGNPFVTGTLNTTTTFYAEEKIAQPIVNVGPAANTIGGGGNFTSTARALRFNVNKSSRLVSVLVYAQGDGYRNIQYRDSMGVVLRQQIVFIPNGENRVTLNFDLQPGGPYELGVSGDTVNLFRNSAGASYPYTDANGVVTITGSNANNAPGYYYYFYDWEVRETDCVSQRTPVTFAILNNPTVSATATNVRCFGAADGGVQVSATLGVQPYSYVWSNAATTATVSNVAAGTYGVTVTDNAGCSATALATVNGPATAVSVTTAALPDTCNRSVGSVEATATGGTGPYTYNWNTGSALTQANLLPAGTYEVTVADANNCTVTATDVVTNGGSINIATAAAPANCFGDASGGVSVSVSAGNAPFAYLWSNGATTDTVTGLAAGSYSVSVTDSYGCSTTATTLVTQPASIQVSAAATPAVCFGSATGTVTATVSGGAAGYNYYWSNGGVDSTLQQLPAGTYGLTVADVNGCTASTAVQVTAADSITASFSVVEPTCYGAANGSIQVYANGGNGSYNYTWGGGFTGDSIGLLGEGVYTVTVTDAANCSTVRSVQVNQPDSVAITLTGADVLCYGANNGYVNAITTGGSGVYTYAWSNQVTDSYNGGLAAGIYTVTVADEKSCTATALFSINQPAEIQFATSTINASSGVDNGSISVANLSGGTAPYMFEWSNGFTGDSATNLMPGTYTLTITDANGCEQSASVLVGTSTSVSTVSNSLSLTVYPNPSTQFVFIAFSGTSPAASVRLFNAAGQTVLSIPTYYAQSPINVSSFAKGNYFFEVEINGQKTVKEVVVR